jgi:hypothetical protein
LTQQRYRASYLAMSENDMPAGKTEEEAPLGQVYDPRALRRTMNEGFLDFDLRFHSTQQRETLELAQQRDAPVSWLNRTKDAFVRQIDPAQFLQKL